MQVNRKRVSFRVARKVDCRLLWQWRNDRRVRKNSFSTEKVRWGEHVKWFESRLNDPDCVIYITMTRGRMPIGQVRYDLQGKSAIVSASLDQRFRGMGYGSEVLHLASKRLFKTKKVVKSIHAYVKPGNRASIAAFAKAGYGRKGTTTFHGHRAFHLVLSRDQSDGTQNRN